MQKKVCRIRTHHAFSVPKAKGDRNEDSYSISDRRRVLALSDGASISYDSASWSAILVRRYTKIPLVDQEWLEAGIADFSKLHDRDSLPWMKQAAFDRGSFATLLGVQLLGDGSRIEVLSVGDSLAILCDGDSIVSTWPYKNAEEFNGAPRLFCTNPVENSFFFEAGPQAFVTQWSLEGLSHPALFCVTDALGLWVLEQRENVPSPMSTLYSLSTKRAFARFVHEERLRGRLKRDDTTLLAMW